MAKDSIRREFIERAPLIAVVEDVLRLLQHVQSDLKENSKRSRKAAARLVGLAVTDLELAIPVHTSGAAHELREVLRTALGPELTVDAVESIAKMLSLLLDCFPVA